MLQGKKGYLLRVRRRSNTDMQSPPKRLRAGVEHQTSSPPRTGFDFQAKETIPFAMNLHHLCSPCTLLSQKPMCPFYRQGSGVQRGEATFMQAEIICLPALTHTPEQNYSTCAHTSTLPHTPNQLQIPFTCHGLLQHISFPRNMLSTSAI